MTNRIQYLSLIRRKDVETRTGLSRSTIYARIAAGTFPSPIDLGGGRAVAWLVSDIDDWIKQRIFESRGENLGGAGNEY
jgi:prophage regulatory protein